MTYRAQPGAAALAGCLLVAIGAFSALVIVTSVLALRVLRPRPQASAPAGEIHATADAPAR